MDQVDELFGEVNVVSTHEVAATFDLSENDARAWADELEVAKVGASFAWTRPDVEALAKALDELEAEDDSDDEGDDAEEQDDDDEEEDEDGDE